MNSNKVVRLINNDYFNVPIQENQLIADHFSDNLNRTREILLQINDYKIYDGLVSENDKIILDIGANIGLFGIHVSPFAEKIYCLEPTPSHFALLKMMTESFSNVECLKLALSNEDGEADWYQFAINTTMNTLFSRDGSLPVAKVRAITLPNLLAKLGLSRVDFCKIDIEGSEIIALDEKTIKQVSSKIKKFYIEFHEYSGIQVNTSCSIYSEYFTNCGYNVKQLNSETLFCERNILWS